jgi:hypothetical protein
LADSDIRTRILVRRSSGQTIDEEGPALSIESPD